MGQVPSFPYDLEKLPRETKRHYISATDEEINEMLEAIGEKSLEDLFKDLPKEIRHKDKLNISEELSYKELAQHVYDLSLKNHIRTSFLGDGLQQYTVTDIVDDICGIRGLTTAYTPYQPERSQGTLQSLWIYQSLLSELTGFEAINSSLYERSTCLYEAINCSMRLVRGTNKAIVASNIYPNDIEVLKTLVEETGNEILFAPIDPATGRVDIEKTRQLIQNTEGVASLSFAQVNCFGLTEDVDALTDLCSALKIKSIAIFDPFLLANGALKAPVNYGSHNQGCDMIVGEGQHLALGPNFGGPGLGIFGIRFNEKDKRSIRSTAGRYIGKAKDLSGRECLSIILSTREQHIRREKATSNICSNQAFVASLAGACMLRRGGEGFEKAAAAGRDKALKTLSRLLVLDGVELKFATESFFNEFTLKLNTDVETFIRDASKEGIKLGVNVTGRCGLLDQMVMISFSDVQTDEEMDRLVSFFESKFNKADKSPVIPEIPKNLIRADKTNLPKLERDDIIDYYQRLGAQNFSPDDGIYPLGSCTMKYNPYINDFTAGFLHFSDLHPQSLEEDCQGSLELLYEIQEIFQEITGLPGVTTQPVAGAQGELVGLKLFQAYHKDKGEKRDVMLIPKSAHGTNPATATMAGYKTIGLIDADNEGRINMTQLKELIEQYKGRVAGIMITNPNTAGIFEANFKEIADLIHTEGGLVYMDGANMNAIAGWVDLGAMGVDAVHNNLHKTWTIPHGGGGPGDAIVAVSERLIPFLPGYQIEKKDGKFVRTKMPKSIGEFHRHYGNFAHKVRAYTYLKALGAEGIKRMSAVAVLSARYLYERLKKTYPILPEASEATPRMHEFIVTLSGQTFDHIASSGTPKANVIARIGKLFLDFGFHAPTVAFPEQYGLMIEPTESFTKKELDDFAQTVEEIHKMVETSPEVLKTVPHFTPIDRVDEVSANKDIKVSEKITEMLPQILKDRLSSGELKTLDGAQVKTKIEQAHQRAVQ
jgi:glycine dehydrogenase